MVLAFGLALLFFAGGCSDDRDDDAPPPTAETPPESPPSGEKPPLPPIPWPPDLPLPPELPWPGPEYPPEELPPGPSEPPPPAGTPEDKTGLLAEINAARAARGLYPVELTSALMCAADRHALDIGKTGTCGHTGSDGSDPFKRARDCGGQADGEIVACGYKTPKAAVEGWTRSPGHAAILYSGDDKKVGVAMFNDYWVAIFL